MGGARRDVGRSSNGHEQVSKGTHVAAPAEEGIIVEAAASRRRPGNARLLAPADQVQVAPVAAERVGKVVRRVAEDLERLVQGQRAVSGAR
jgi:hypothetical protein